MLINYLTLLQVTSDTQGDAVAAAADQWLISQQPAPEVPDGFKLVASEHLPITVYRFYEQFMSAQTACLQDHHKSTGQYDFESSRWDKLRSSWDWWCYSRCSYNACQAAAYLPVRSMSYCRMPLPGSVSGPCTRSLMSMQSAHRSAGCYVHGCLAAGCVLLVPVCTHHCCCLAVCIQLETCW